jgi:hypothetical protein
LIPILQFIHTQVYKYLFGKPADGLERSVEGEDECKLSVMCELISFRHVDTESTDSDATYFDSERYGSAQL